MTSYPIVAMEGIDGAGKTTLRNHLWDALLQRGIPAVAMGQHSWLDIEHSRLLAQLRLSEGPSDHNVSDLQRIRSAYLEDKHLHWVNSIERCASQAVVLLDRYFLSDAVYLDALYGLDWRQTVDCATELGLTTPPDYLIFLDLDEVQAEKRINERGRETRHYEKAVSLRTIRSVYHQALNERAEPGSLYQKSLHRFVSHDRSDLLDCSNSLVRILTEAVSALRAENLDAGDAVPLGNDAAIGDKVRDEREISGSGVGQG